MKTNTIGYIHQEEFESITRSKLSLKVLDRIRTSIYGLKRGIEHAQSEKEVSIVEEYFIYKSLIATTRLFYSSRPSSWLVVWRVMKQHRILEKEFNIKSNALKVMKAKSYGTKFRTYFIFHWLVSHIVLTNQEKYFENIRKKTGLNENSIIG